MEILSFRSFDVSQCKISAKVKYGFPTSQLPSKYGYFSYMYSRYFFCFCNGCAPSPPPPPPGLLHQHCASKAKCRQKKSKEKLVVMSPFPIQCWSAHSTSHDEWLKWNCPPWRSWEGAGQDRPSCARDRRGLTADQLRHVSRERVQHG